MRKIVILFALFVCTSSLSIQAQTKKVLFVLSGEDTLMLNKGENQRQTGVFLNEFFLAYHAIISEGYKVDFATPNGVKATIDQESIDDEYWKEQPSLKQKAIDFWKTNRKFSNPFTLNEVLNRTDEYIGLVIPGGQGLMVDLYYNTDIPKLLKSFAEKKKAIGLICHVDIPEHTAPLYRR